MDISKTQFFPCHIPKEWENHFKKHFKKAEGTACTNTQLELYEDINAENRIRLKTSDKQPWGKQWVVRVQHRKNPA